MRRATLLLLAIAAALVVPSVAWACPVCYGQIEGPAAEGVNNGVMAMLAVVGVVQLGFVAMFVGMWRRSRRQTKPEESSTGNNGGVR